MLVKPNSNNLLLLICALLICFLGATFAANCYAAAYAEHLFLRGLEAYSQEKYEDAKCFWENSLKWQKEFPSLKYQYSESAQNLAYLLMRTDNFDESNHSRMSSSVGNAEVLLKEAIAIRHAAGDELGRADSLNLLRCLYMRQHRCAEAESPAQMTFDIRKKILGKKDILTLLSAANLAEVLVFLDRSEEANLILDNVTSDLKHGSFSSFAQADALAQLSRIFSTLDRLEDSRRLTLDVLAIRSKRSGRENDLAVASSKHDLAEIYRAQGFTSKANLLEKESLALRQFDCDERL